jgi:hypothetical protein
MEASSYAPILTFLGSSTIRAMELQVFLFCLFVLWGTNSLTRLLNNLRIMLRIKRFLTIVYLILASLLGVWLLKRDLNVAELESMYNRPIRQAVELRNIFPIELIIILAVLLLTWRGIYIAKEWTGRSSVISSLQRGIFFFAGYGLIFNSAENTSLEYLLPIFLLACLFGLVSGRLGSLFLLRGGAENAFSSVWLANISLSIAMVLGAVLIAVVLIIQQLERLFQLLRLVIYTILITIASPIFMLLGLMEPSLDALQQAIPTPTPEPIIPPWELENAQVAPEEVVDLTQSSLDILTIVIPALMAVVILLILVIILKMIGWNIRIRQKSKEERESLLEGSGILRWLLNALRNRAQMTAAALLGSARLGRRERIQAAAEIRQIYGHLLDLSAELGKPRLEAQTPLEYLPVLREIYTSEMTELMIITQGYLRVRYGLFPETEAEIQAIHTAWKIVRARGSAIKKAVNLGK